MYSSKRSSLLMPKEVSRPALDSLNSVSSARALRVGFFLRFLEGLELVLGGLKSASGLAFFFLASLVFFLGGLCSEAEPS